jgi:hypothetical protein
MALSEPIPQASCVVKSPQGHLPSPRATTS